MSNPKENVSIKELAETLCETFKDRDIKIICQATEKDYINNKFSNTSIFSIDKIKSIGWIPKTGIKEGFKRTVNSFEERS